MLQYSIFYFNYTGLVNHSEGGVILLIIGVCIICNFNIYVYVIIGGEVGVVFSNYLIDSVYKIS